MDSFVNLRHSSGNANDNVLLGVVGIQKSSSGIYLYALSNPFEGRLLIGPVVVGLQSGSGLN